MTAAGAAAASATPAPGPGAWADREYTCSLVSSRFVA